MARAWPETCVPHKSGGVWFLRVLESSVGLGPPGCRSRISCHGGGCAMSSKPSELALEVVRRDADACVLAVSGELSLCSAGLVTRAVSKALLDVGRVLVDVSGLRLTWRPAIQVFPSVLAGVGGWPRARLVVFGADAELARTLTV